MYLAHQAVHRPLGLPPDDVFSEEELALLEEIDAGSDDSKRTRFAKVFQEGGRNTSAVRVVGASMYLRERPLWRLTLERRAIYEAEYVVPKSYHVVNPDFEWCSTLDGSKLIPYALSPYAGRRYRLLRLAALADARFEKRTVACWRARVRITLTCMRCSP